MPENPFDLRLLLNTIEKGLSIWILLYGATGTITAQHRYVERKSAVPAIRFRSARSNVSVIHHRKILPLLYDSRNLNKLITVQ